MRKNVIIYYNQHTTERTQADSLSSTRRPGSALYNVVSRTSCVRRIYLREFIGSGVVPIWAPRIWGYNEVILEAAQTAMPPQVHRRKCEGEPRSLFVVFNHWMRNQPVRYEEYIILDAVTHVEGLGRNSFTKSRNSRQYCLLKCSILLYNESWTREEAFVVN
jgi:hypothetical protein